MMANRSTDACVVPYATYGTHKSRIKWENVMVVVLSQTPGRKRRTLTTSDATLQRVMEPAGVTLATPWERASLPGDSPQKDIREVGCGQLGDENKEGPTRREKGGDFPDRQKGVARVTPPGRWETTASSRRVQGRKQKKLWFQCKEEGDTSCDVIQTQSLKL